MKKLDVLAAALLVIGGLNWGLVGLFGFDLVATIFGEMSVLLGEPPAADIIALRQLHVLHLGGPELEGFLRDHPPVMLRMLKTVALRLRNANRWRS